eukprot:TRINITY_DN3866_c0_g3_i1.p1 TRINITY_DN3866_c0_g3~~TRINITY_DN3866_c0_g3_i1.p1  ORF type:complete len:773 (+),score=195.26 TRINITY_DN3866_c0_g3_i1:58-2319(+)
MAADGESYGSGLGVGQFDLNALPNLPGFAYKRKVQKTGRPQSFQYVNGVPIEHKEGVTFERPKLVAVQKNVKTRRLGNHVPTTCEEFEGQEQVQTALPAWDALDRHVLRFYGFFKEAVIETNLETERVRKATIYYYLEDDTCEINEKKGENSGMQQGKIVRRHRFPGMSGGYLHWEDLQVGGLLHIYGRAIRLTECDAFTRQFYAGQGIQQADMEDDEEDAFGMSLPAKGGYHGMQKSAEKQFREVMIGGGHVNANMQQFLEWDKKVCRFYAVLDDMTKPEFERRPFIILYFLADDQVEIRELYPLNSGRDNFPIFFRKGPLERGPLRVRNPMEHRAKKDECVNASDFAVGQTIQLLGKEFYVYDADDFTRMYFEQELGTTLEERQDVRLPERTVPRPPTPPYTGYGTWDDSMGSVMQLMPKQPVKDFNKLFYNDGKVLRFTAQYHNPKPEDAERLFVFNFHLFDDTLSVHEPPQRNMGIMTGRYLEKSVHMNQMTGKIFKAQDFYPGSVVKVYNREFEIVDMDEYTRNFIENVDSSSSKFDLQAVMEKLRSGMQQSYPLVRDVFRKFDADRDGVITVVEFKTALERYGFKLADEEVFIIMKHFDTRQDGQVSYNEFCDALLDEDYTRNMLPTKPVLDDSYDAEYAEKAKRKLQERVETDKVRAAVRRLGDVVYRNTATFNRLFKVFSRTTHEDVVTCQQVVEALKSIGHIFTYEDVMRVLLYVLPNCDPQRINYVQFLKAVVVTFHDLSNVR